MRYIVDDQIYEGTPEEIAALLKQLSSTREAEASSFLGDDFTPLEDVVNDSADLRRKLAEDPAYNPHGGVVASKEGDDSPPPPTVSADLDTGVELK